MQRHISVFGFFQMTAGMVDLGMVARYDHQKETAKNQTLVAMQIGFLYAQQGQLIIQHFQTLRGDEAFLHMLADQRNTFCVYTDIKQSIDRLLRIPVPDKHRDTTARLLNHPLAAFSVPSLSGKHMKGVWRKLSPG